MLIACNQGLIELSVALQNSQRLYYASIFRFAQIHLKLAPVFQHGGEHSIMTCNVYRVSSRLLYTYTGLKHTSFQPKYMQIKKVGPLLLHSKYMR
jgi:hypothetical protein